MTERSATDDELKAEFLTAAFDGNERSFGELRRALGWSKETFDGIRNLLGEEGKIKALSPEDKQEQESRQDRLDVSIGLLLVRPEWLGRLLNVSAVIAVPVGVIGLACAAAFVGGISFDAVWEGIGGKAGWTDVFHWSDPFLRVSVIGLIVGLLAAIYATVLRFVSTRLQGARPTGHFTLLGHIVTVVPIMVWRILLIVLKDLAHAPPGSPPDQYIPVRPDDPRLHPQSANT